MAKKERDESALSWGACKYRYKACALCACEWMRVCAWMRLVWLGNVPRAKRRYTT